MPKVTIVDPEREGYSGLVANVQFANGVGETDNPGSLAFFRRRSGYRVDEPARKPVRAKADDPKE